MYANLIIVLCIFLHLQLVCCEKITVHSDNIPEDLIYSYDTIIPKSNLRSCSDHYCNYAYYCRNNTCVEIDTNEDDKPYIAFPDENGNKKIYIVHACTYEAIKNNQCENFVSYDGLTTCERDSDCFYNKCVDEHCAFNDDPSITYCDNIYHYFAAFDFSYIHCGKASDDTCSKNNECSSKKCKKGYCYRLNNEYSYNDYISREIDTILLLLVIIFIILICCICRCCCHRKTENKNKNNNFEKIQK